MAFFRRLEQNPSGHKTVSPRRTKRPQDVPICIFLVWRTSILHSFLSWILEQMVHNASTHQWFASRSIEFVRQLEQNPSGHKTICPRLTKRPHDMPICIFLVWHTHQSYIHYSRVFWNRCHTTQVDMDCITRQIHTKGIVDRIRRTIEHDGMISLWTSSGAHITKWLREGWRYAWNNHQRLGQERRWNKTALSDSGKQAQEPIHFIFSQQLIWNILVNEKAPG